MLRVVPPPQVTEAEIASSSLYRFQVEPLGDDKKQSMVLSGLFVGRPMEASVRSHWMAYPSLKAACIRLMAIIGPQWRTSEELPPLIVECIEDATHEAVRAVQEDGLKANHVVAVYLSALADCALVTCSYVTSATRGQVRVRWPPLTMPVAQWAEANANLEAVVESGQKPTDAHQDGLKSQLLTQIATPTEVGMVMRNYF